jgi:transcription elongation factor GreA
MTAYNFYMLPKRLSQRKFKEFKKSTDEAVPLTEEGLKRLQTKLETLKHSIPGLAAEAQRTAAYGDRSDNAEYKEAKSQLRRTQGRIFGIEDQLRRAQVIKKSGASGTVQLGSVVTIEFEGTKKTYEILGPHETDPAHGRISNKSPLGAILMDHKKGDTVTLQTENGSRTYRIIDIK